MVKPEDADVTADRFRTRAQVLRFSPASTATFRCPATGAVIVDQEEGFDFDRLPAARSVLAAEFCGETYVRPASGVREALRPVTESLQREQEHGADGEDPLLWNTERLAEILPSACVLVEVSPFDGETMHFLLDLGLCFEFDGPASWKE